MCKSTDRNNRGVGDIACTGLNTNLKPLLTSFQNEHTSPAVSVFSPLVSPITRNEARRVVLGLDRLKALYAVPFWKCGWDQD